jgi:hypothetical protein
LHGLIAAEQLNQAKDVLTIKKDATPMSFFSCAISCQAILRVSLSLPGCLFLSFSDCPTSHHCIREAQEDFCTASGPGTAAAAADAVTRTAVHLLNLVCLD